MPLTKNDLHQIKSIIDTSIDQAITGRLEPRFEKIDQRFDKLETDIEDLAQMSQHQFAAIDDRFNQLEGRLHRAKFQF